MDTPSSSKHLNLEVEGTLSVDTPSDMSGQDTFALWLASRRFNAFSGPCFVCASGAELGPLTFSEYYRCRGLFAFITNADDPNCQIGIFNESTRTFVVKPHSRNRFHDFPVLSGIPISFWNANTSGFTHGLIVRPLTLGFFDRSGLEIHESAKSAIAWLTGLIRSSPLVPNCTVGSETKAPGANQEEQIPLQTDWRDINTAWEECWWSAWEQEANRQAEPSGVWGEPRWRMAFSSNVSAHERRLYFYSSAFISDQGIVHIHPPPSVSSVIP